MIILAGAGNMGFAMLSRWLDQGVQVCVFDPNPTESVLFLQKQKGFALNPARLEGEVEALVLAVKPDSVLSAVREHQKYLSEHSLLISIAAGVRLAPILEAGGHLKVGAVRVMPNTAARIGQGVISLYAHPRCSAEQRALATRLMEVLGQVEHIKDEAEMDAVTVLSGCGAVYLFCLAELLTEAGVAFGLEQDWARRAMRGTFIGAAALLAEFKDGSDGVQDAMRVLRSEITSPNGVAEAGLEFLLKDQQFKKIVKKVFKVAHQRARVLGQEVVHQQQAMRERDKEGARRQAIRAPDEGAHQQAAMIALGKEIT